MKGLSNSLVASVKGILEEGKIGEDGYSDRYITGGTIALLGETEDRFEFILNKKYYKVNKAQLDRINEVV